MERNIKADEFKFKSGYGSVGLNCVKNGSNQIPCASHIYVVLSAALHKEIKEMNKENEL